MFILFQGAPIEIDRVESDEACAGHIKFIQDDRVNTSYVDYGFSDCEESLDGTIIFFLSEKQKVDYVRIATPSDCRKFLQYFLTAQGQSKQKKTRPSEVGARLQAQQPISIFIVLQVFEETFFLKVKKIKILINF